MNVPDTPMLAQYRALRRSLPGDTILFFRLGDFYEMFFEDARTAAPVLDVALTKRNGYPMCGVPYHAAESYLARLVRAGIKVAICDQVEDPKAAKGIVRREVTRVVTPGTILEEVILDARSGNYLTGLWREGPRWGLAALDLSTGEFWVEDADDPAALRDVLARLAPSEVVVPEEASAALGLDQITGGLEGAVITPAEDWRFEPATARELLTRHFQVHSLAGFGCADDAPSVGAAGAILQYVQEDLRRDLGHVRRLQVRHPADYLVLDAATLANLDLLPRPGRDPGPSLLSTLDATRTAMGARRLREWLTRPLARAETIRARHDAVEDFHGHRATLSAVRDALEGVRDLERLTVRIGAGSGSPRDVRAVGLCLEAIPALQIALQGATANGLVRLAGELDPQPDLVKRIAEALVDEPPARLQDGGVIRAGWNPELDELRHLAKEGRQWLAEYQASEQQRTGIKSLKVRHNKVFGYYIEVTKSNLAQVPDTYVRKQTMVNAERFITPELKEYERKIVGAEEKAVALEAELFEDLRQAVVAETDRLQRTASALADLDVLAAFAERALACDYVRPAITDANEIRIRDGRHPVVEQMPGAPRFVPNDTRLDGLADQIMLITGPNMAGKSTYIRQVALMVIMAQMGAFVPAREATLGVVDRVFSRVGASDDLARGRSTFMVEMQETANILHAATPRSLVILDEIGRGTSTYDGLSIAWAVVEYLHETLSAKAKTLFATHYHELTQLAHRLPGVQNYNVLVREQGKRIAFLHRIEAGAADRSYGIHVARLAGLPDAVIDRAEDILAALEDADKEEHPRVKERRPVAAKRKPSVGQLDLFG